MITWVIWQFISVLFPGIVHCNDGYLIVAPAVFRPGVQELISVTILHPSAPITVESKLITQQGEVIAQVGREIFGKGSLILEVPENSKGFAQLKVCGNCLSTVKGDYSFFNTSSVLIEERGSVLFIDTDKPIYKPGQTVFITAMTTSIDLKPIKKDVTLYVEDGQGTRVARWDKLNEICLGVYEIQLSLSTQPVLGKWVIRSEVEGHEYNKSFSVDKYVLPRFSVDILPPPYIRDWSACQELTVTARYVYRQDVHGRLTGSVTLKGFGYYSDYQGNTQEFDMRIDGVAKFNVCASDLIRNEVGEHFRGHLHVEAKVVTPDGKSMKVTDGTCVVNKQLVDVMFSADTRHHFKPGIPFKGKVNVMNPDGSAAENVTILIRTDVNGGNFSAKIYDVISGVVHFEIPELPLATNVAWIEAKVLHVGWTEVGHTYISSHMSVTGWYSPSKCQALVDAQDMEFQVGKDARFELKSTCPCNFTLFFEVISRGNIVHSGIHYSHHHDKRNAEVHFSEQSIDSSSRDQLICSTNFKFTIIPKMAPLSRLLVYYVRENGEGVADSMTLNIKPAFENMITILPSVKTASPGDNVKMTTRTFPDNCVCLTATDSSLYFLGKNDKLNTDKIFDEMLEFDVTLVEKEEPYWWGLSRRRKRSLDFWTLLKNKDAKFAFEEAGMLVLTDRVRLHHGKDLGSISGPVFHRPGYLTVEAMEVFMRERLNQINSICKQRAFFPDTWFRKCYNTSSSGKYNSFRVTLPDSITTWVINGFTFSPSDGLAVASSAEITVAKQFFVEFTPPFAIKRGEQVEISITVYNYFDYCAEVYLNVDFPRGVTLDRKKDDEWKMAMCIGHNTSISHSLLFSFETLGSVNLTAIAEAYPSLRCCSGTPTTNWSLTRRKIVGYDHVTRVVNVEPEGVLKEYTNSVFLCPKERLQITTPAIFVYQYLPRPEGMTGFTFTVRAAASIHVAMATLPGEARNTIEIVLGGNDNTLSSISSSQPGVSPVTSETPVSLSTVEYRAFWVSWDQHVVRVGFGQHINYDQLMSFNAHDTFDVQYIGFATSSGLPANFKIWTDSDGTYGEVFHLGIPSNKVKGSTRGYIKLIGDVMGPSMRNVDRLLRLPHGCGEQNMVYFAPDIHILTYLKKTKQLKTDVEEKALQMMITGYQRQLTYQRSDGSYSAFGDKDATGSLWLTAFVLRSFIQAKQFIYIDQTVIERTENWVLSYQNDDGSFPTVGRVINKEIQAGAHSSIPLTAYVLTTLVELPHEDEFVQGAIQRAKSFLEENVSVMSDPYSAALSSYALSLVKSDVALVALRKLNQMALTSDDMRFWKISAGRQTQKNLIYTFADDMTKTVSSAEVEVAAYALLTYSSRGDVTSALPVVKWLSRNRNSWGGFSSTHDTSVALYALSKFAALIYNSDLNITVTLASTNLDLQKKLTLHIGNSDVVQSVSIPTLPTGLFVSAVGDGCALLQVEVAYNVPDPDNGQAFHLAVKVQTTSRGRNREMTLEVCFSWMHAGSSNMAVSEVELISGFEADVYTLEELLTSDRNIKKYEIENKTVVFYLNEVNNQCRTCLTFKAVQTFHVGSVKSSLVKIYDYYEPAYETTAFYYPGEIEDLSGTQCEDKLCNEVNGETEEETVETTSCSNNPLGCDEAKIHIPKCLCYEDCSGSNSPVCASDGLMYAGICQMKMAACEKSAPIKVAHEHLCKGSKNDEDLNSLKHVDKMSARTSSLKTTGGTVRKKS